MKIPLVAWSDYWRCAVLEKYTWLIIAQFYFQGFKQRKKQAQPQHLTAPAPSGEMLQSKKNVFLSCSNCKNHRLLSGLSHISCMQLCREAYSPKSMCVCALNRHTSSLSLAACACACACLCVCMRCSVTSVCTCLVVTGQQT